MFIGKTFEDENNVPSSMRVVYIISIFTIIGTWAYISICARQLLAFDPTQVSVIAILLGAKIGQKHFEVKEKIDSNKNINKGANLSTTHG